MVLLMVIADDLTGALDSGVKFAQLGIITQIFPNPECSFQTIKDQTEVIIVNSESRHISAQAAYRKVYSLVKHALDFGITHFYKKTDSALRGHIGAELSALYKAVRQTVCFIPALPQENRFTEKGIHYINGVPVAESIFASDPFNPVQHSEVAKVIGEESHLKVKSVTRQEYKNLPLDADILVFDADSDRDLQILSGILQEQRLCSVTAGCAGFAAWLAKCLPLKKGQPCCKNHMDKLYVICGSINDISKKQLNFARDHGFERVTLSAEQMLSYGFYNTEKGKQFLGNLHETSRKASSLIVDVASDDPADDVTAYAKQHSIDSGEIAWRIAERLGETAEKMLQWKDQAGLLIIGGDTLSAFIKRYENPVITPVCEPRPGTVLMNFEHDGRCRQLLSKSGGFGEPDLLIHLADYVIS